MPRVVIYHYYMIVLHQLRTRITGAIAACNQSPATHVRSWPWALQVVCHFDTSEQQLSQLDLGLNLYE